MNLTSTRAGIIKRNITGYDSFIPKELPPDPPLKIDDEITNPLVSPYLGGKYFFRYSLITVLSLDSPFSTA